MSTPAARWRAIVRDGMQRVSGDDEQFHGYLREHFPAAAGLERFVLAVGLLSFGRLDVVDAILEDLPAVGHPARMLARSVDDIMPTGTNVLADPVATRRWFIEHRELLAWDEENGRFKLPG